MIGVGLFAADTDEEARRLFTSAQLQFLNLIRGHPGKLPPPVESMDGRWSPAERAAVEHRTRCSAVGSPETVRRRLEELLDETGADEVIATAQIFDHGARLRSFEIGAEIFRRLTNPLKVVPSGFVVMISLSPSSVMLLMCFQNLEPELFLSSSS